MAINGKQKSSEDLAREALDAGISPLNSDSLLLKGGDAYRLNPRRMNDLGYMSDADRQRLRNGGQTDEEKKLAELAFRAQLAAAEAVYDELSGDHEEYDSGSNFLPLRALKWGREKFSEFQTAAAELTAPPQNSAIIPQTKLGVFAANADTITEIDEATPTLAQRPEARNDPVFAPQKFA